MAKKQLVADDAMQQEEMVVTVVRFKGSGESMRKGFEVLAGAFSAFGPAVVTQKAIGSRVAAGQLKATVTTVEGEASAGVRNGDGPVDDLDEETPYEAPGPAKRKKPAEPKKFTFLTDFNLSPVGGAPSLKQFCADKNPQAENEKYLVISSWLQLHGGADPFTPNHVYTCFQAMGSALGWRTQSDVMQPIRQMKARKNLFANPERGTWRLTQPGLDAAAEAGKA